MLQDGERIGPYRLGRLLGRGGMAVVYEATHESVGRTVALKFLSPDVADATFAERFRDEGRMQAALDHPHIVPVYEAGTSPYGPYLAMRLVRGTTLAGLIDGGGLSSERTLLLLEQVAGALDAAHDAGLVHRDVKPRNVLVEDGEHAYLADFGLTRGSDTTGRTASGQFMGTIAYAAPEVVAGGTPGPAADRYALAAVLFECLTGTPVFPRPSHAAVLYAHSHEPPPRVSGRREGIPSALDEVLINALAKDPKARPARAAELLAQARGALTGIELGPPAPRVLTDAEDDGTTAGQVTLPGTPRPRPPRRRTGSLVAAGLAGLALGAAAVGLLSDGDPAPAAASLPAAPPGTERLGSSLASDGRTVACAGARLTPDSPNCTVFQDRLPGATLVVPSDGVVRRWGVRAATGEMALSVMRRDGDSYFQVGRSRNEFVDDAGPHFFSTDLVVERGDRLGVTVLDGAGIGLASADGTTGRFRPLLVGLGKRHRPGPPGELLMRADFLPGGKQRRPLALEGRDAAAAPAGRTLERRRIDSDYVDEARLLLVDGKGALEFSRRGRRVARIEIPDMRAPIGAVTTFEADPLDEKSAAAYFVFNRAESDRLVRHYVTIDGTGIVLVT